MKTKKTRVEISRHLLKILDTSGNYFGVNLRKTYDADVILRKTYGADVSITLFY